MGTKSKAEKAQVLGEETTNIQLALDMAHIALTRLLPIVQNKEYYEGLLETFITIQHDLTQLQNMELEALYPKPVITHKKPVITIQHKEK